MKKVLALILALVLVLSLVACGGGGNKDDTSAEANDGTAEEANASEIAVFSLGETVSSDTVDFTLKEAAIYYYASAVHDETYAKPIDKSDGGIFTAAKGHVLVCMTFTIKNNDSTTLDAGGEFGKWGMYFSIGYNSSGYIINGFDLNEKDGRLGLRFDYSAVSYDGGKTFSQYTSSNILIKSGQSVTVRVVGISTFEPNNLNDTFYLNVNIPYSNSDEEYFSYEVN